MVSHRFQLICRDEKLWKILCFESSRFETRRQSRQLIDPNSEAALLACDHTRSRPLEAVTRYIQAPEGETQSYKNVSDERIRAIANWDPSYPDEEVNWYQEYIHRHGPVSLSWLEQPIDGAYNSRHRRELCGMAILDVLPMKRQLVVAPLDDGSLCLWNVDEPSWDRGDLSDVFTDKRGGKIISRSRPGLLSVNGSDSMMNLDVTQIRAKMMGTGVAECVSVDSAQKKAYIAVQSGLNEVDLSTMQVVSHERFPFSIAAVSEANSPIPITVATNLSLHLYDPRTARLSTASDKSSDVTTHCEICEVSERHRGLQYILSEGASPAYASLFQPGPCSILHVAAHDGNWDSNGEIYVAGRFSNILNYDRRAFPKMRGAIHSGARLSSLTSVQHAFAALEREAMYENKLPISAAYAAKQIPGYTLVAGGEYNGKGSLEMYGISPIPEYTTNSSSSGAGKNQHSVYKNRQSASRSKLLSVVGHGTRLVTSDGDGNIKWVERDGVSEVRSVNINAAQGSEEQTSLWSGVTDTRSQGISDHGPGDVARKLLPLRRSGPGEDEMIKDDLLLWTGERVAVLSFTTEPIFEIEAREDKYLSLEEAAERKREDQYGGMMRRALKQQADEVRFMQGLGLRG